MQRLRGTRILRITGRNAQNAERSSEKKNIPIQHGPQAVRQVATDIARNRIVTEPWILLLSTITDICQSVVMPQPVYQTVIAIMNAIVVVTARMSRLQ